MHPDTPTKMLANIIAKYKLKKIIFHSLRHTNVSLMISKGVQTQIISRKFRHSSVQATVRIYSHFFDDEFKAVANVMNEFYWCKLKEEIILFFFSLYNSEVIFFKYIFEKFYRFLVKDKKTGTLKFLINVVAGVRLELTTFGL